MAKDEELQALASFPSTSSELLHEREEALQATRTRRRRILVVFSALALSFLLWRANPTITYSVSKDNQGPKVLDVFGHRSLNGKRAEKLFLTVPDEESAIQTSRRYTAQPHMAGSPQDLITAIDFLSVLQQELGVDAPSLTPIFSAGSPESRSATLNIPKTDEPKAWIDVYYPVLNTPLERALQVLDVDGAPVWEAELEEVADDTDPDAGKYYDAVPAFHGLSKDGEVEGELVYANYGRPEDYEELEQNGVDLTGKIVICRYGKNFRGLKIKAAQELGAAGVLIYSDLRDDGTVTAENGYDHWPYGPARNPNSVQRGSVQFISMYPGDPTTPGYPSYENSTRTAGESIPDIPSLPISANSAERLIKEASVTGRTVRLVNHVNEKVTPIWNTMAVIPGHIKDEVVVVGNHRDAWVLGASDPSSGTVSLLEIVRGFGALLDKGWKPLRSILIASWDGEEYGLIGSTEWGEDFHDFISSHVVSYLNVDTSSSGSRLVASGSPSLAHLIWQTASEIEHPTNASKTLWDARDDRGKLTGPVGSPPENATTASTRTAKHEPNVNPLGSGSDYTIFLQHIGIASGNGGFSSTLSDPVYHYHSVFDSQMWQETYGDPGFHRHVAVAKHLGLQTLRLADSIILPLNTTHYALQLDSYLDKVENTAFDLELDADFTPLRISIGALQNASLALDKEKVKAEKNLKRVLKRHRKKTWLSSLRRRLRKLAPKLFGKCSSADALLAELEPTEHDAILSVISSFRSTNIWKKKHPSKALIKAVKRVRTVNKKLVAFERGFISTEGIKERQWYKHLGVAPGKWLGYGATTLPALTEALTLDRNITEAQHEAARLQDLIDNLTRALTI